jgi:hypothetical protein
VGDDAIAHAHILSCQAHVGPLYAFPRKNQLCLQEFDLWETISTKSCRYFDDHAYDDESLIHTTRSMASSARIFIETVAASLPSIDLSFRPWTVYQQCHDSDVHSIIAEARRAPKF